MDRYAVIGHPVTHSRSPWIHQRFAALTGQPVDYGRIEAPLDGFTDTVRAFAAAGGRGCNVTLPFKHEAWQLAVRRTERAERAGALNTLRFDAEGWWGDNTDGVGLVQDLREHGGVELSGARVLLIGAGGAAAGVLGPLLEARPAALRVVNRTVERARALVDSHADLAGRFGVELDAAGLDQAGSGHDVVINGTASSLAGGGVPVAADALRIGGTGLDMMYGAPARGFLEWVRARGGHGRDGLGMLVEQAAEAFAAWRGVRPPTAGVLAELRALVDAA